MLTFIVGVAVGVVADRYWPQIKAKLVSWYEATVGKV